MKAHVKDPFVSYLQSLVERGDRRALAALRRGLGRPLGTVPEMYPYVVPWLPADPPLYKENAYYLIAALFGFAPASTAAGNMGDHMAATRTKDNQEAVERRFVVLLSSAPDALDKYLIPCVSWLKSREVAVHWDQLLWDVLNWGRPDKRVQRRWAGAFWGARELKPREAES